MCRLACSAMMFRSGVIGWGRLAPPPLPPSKSWVAKYPSNCRVAAALAHTTHLSGVKQPAATVIINRHRTCRLKVVRRHQFRPGLTLSRRMLRETTCIMHFLYCSLVVGGFIASVSHTVRSLPGSVVSSVKDRKHWRQKRRGSRGT